MTALIAEGLVAEGLAAEAERDDPATLFRVMQTMIGEGLKRRYEPPKKLSHELLVLLMEMKERERREKAAAQSSSGNARAAKKGVALNGGAQAEPVPSV